MKTARQFSGYAIFFVSLLVLAGCFPLARRAIMVDREEKYGVCTIYQKGDHELLIVDPKPDNKYWGWEITQKPQILIKSPSLVLLPNVIECTISGEAPWRSSTASISTNDGTIPGSVISHFDEISPDTQDPSTPANALITKKRPSYNPVRYVAAAVALPVDIIFGIFTFGMHNSVGYGKLKLHERSQASIRILPEKHMTLNKK